MIEPYAGAYAEELPAGRTQRPPSTVDFTVAIARHVPSWWNFLFALLLLVPYPIYRLVTRAASPKGPDT